MPPWDDEYGAVTARYYDAAYSEILASGADVAFYRELAHETGGPVLELGCGTGRVLLPVARAGLACCGVDPSREMLAALAKKPGAERVELVQARMQDFHAPGARFRLVYSAFRAFQHLYTPDDQLRALAAVQQCLAPGGTFAFDVFNPILQRLSNAAEPETEDLRFADGEDLIVRYTAQRHDPVMQTIELSMRYERRRAGEVISNEEARFRMRWYTRFELQHLLARAGFSHVAIFGDFDCTPVREGSPQLVVVATA